MAKQIISIDLGGTNFRVGLVKNNIILNYFKNKTPKNRKDLLDLFIESINEFNSWKVKGIGVSSPGPLIGGVL